MIDYYMYTNHLSLLFIVYISLDIRFAFLLVLQRMKPSSSANNGQRI